MYERFFGLTGKPFSLLPDADNLFPSKRHRRVINMLNYSTDTAAGFMVVSGDIGAGKTTAVRHYLKHLGPDITVGMLTNSSRCMGRLLAWVATAFDLDEKSTDDSQLYNAFVQFLIAQYAAGKRTILIIDEAQNLSAMMLEDLRLLSNVNNEQDQLLQIVLVGQPELLTRLQQPELSQLVQRIAVHVHLTPLDPAETAAYIGHRLSRVGGDAALFDDTAAAAVHYFTGGVPRLINLLCDQAMMYAFAEDQQRVTFAIVAEVVADRNGGGLSAFTALPPDDDLTDKIAPLLAEIKNAASAEEIE